MFTGKSLHNLDNLYKSECWIMESLDIPIYVINASESSRNTRMKLRLEGFRSEYSDLYQSAQNETLDLYFVY